MNSMKMALTAIGLVGVLATPALAGRDNAERNYYAERGAYGGGERNFVHEQAHRSHAAAYKASTEQKGPSCTHAVVRVAASAAFDDAIGGAVWGARKLGPAGVAKGAAEGAVIAGVGMAVHTVRTDPACTGKKESEKKESKEKDPDKKDPDHSFSA
ncbi:MAG: hypothetical protein V6Z86_01380 [Hyphomicrobiales bacterium]